jgi:DNA-binding beta-propeller fold protein YncE
MVGSTYNGSNIIDVVNDTSNSLTGTFSFGPVILMGSAFDSETGQILVTNQYGEDVFKIDTDPLGEDGTIVAPGIPIGVVFDPGTDQVFVANQWSNYAGIVGVYAGVDYRSVGSVTVGAGSRGIAYDSQLGEVFVTCPWVDSISVINDTNDSVGATIPLSSSGASTGLPLIDYYVIGSVVLVAIGVASYSFYRSRKRSRSIPPPN